MRACLASGGAEESVEWRQIGLYYGPGDMLMKMELTYGEEEAIQLCDEIGFAMADTAIAASAMLAKEKGASENATWKRL
ncbi:MAG: hypothetical protein ACLUOI_39255 [Eisenbergiella sp.]